MKIYFVLALLALACACTHKPIESTTRSTASATVSGITTDDLNGDYFVAKSTAGNSHVVEMKFQKDSPNSLLVISYRQATLDSGPSIVCLGNAELQGNILTSDVVCKQDEYVFQVDIGGAKASDFSKGTPVKVRAGMSGEWLTYTLRKQAKPYFQ